MTTSTGSARFAVDQCPTPVDADSDGFQLDVRIVEAGPVAAALTRDTRESSSPGPESGDIQTGSHSSRRTTL